MWISINHLPRYTHKTARVAMVLIMIHTLFSFTLHNYTSQPYCTLRECFISHTAAESTEFKKHPWRSSLLINKFTYQTTGRENPNWQAYTLIRQPLYTYLEGLFSVPLVSMGLHQRFPLPLYPQGCCGNHCAPVKAVGGVSLARRPAGSVGG